MSEIMVRRAGVMMSKEARLSVDAVLHYYVNRNSQDSVTFASFDRPFYTTTTPIKSGETVSFYGSLNTAANAFYYESGGTLHAPLVAGKGMSSLMTYSWTATLDCNVGICALIENNIEYFTIGTRKIYINYP